MILDVGDLSDTLFSRVVIDADEALLEIEDNYPESRLILLLNNNLLEINDTVVRYILDHKYIGALALMYSKVDTQEYILKLIKTVGVELDKGKIIQYALQNNLSGNLNFILSNFKDFDYIEEFIVKLQEERDFGDINFNLLNDNFITFVIKSPTVNEQSKAGLLHIAMLH